MDAGAKSTVVPSGSSLDRPTIPEIGQFRFNTTLNRIETWNGSAWTTLPTSGIVPITKDVFVGDGTTTSFTMSRTVLNDTDVLVFADGIYQSAGLSYAVNGTSIDFNDPIPLNVVVEVLHGYNEVI